MIVFSDYIFSTHAQTTTFPFFFEKETPSVGKTENLLSQCNGYRSAICHNLFLLTFLLSGPIYRRNKSGRLQVRVSVCRELFMAWDEIYPKYW